jgi:hypothetical protein
MSEQLSFALVLLAGIASVASMILLSGASATGNAVAGLSLGTGAVAAQECSHVCFPGHAQAAPLLDTSGNIVLSSYGYPVCFCPR